jgi:hypothetical protein
VLQNLLVVGTKSVCWSAHAVADHVQSSPLDIGVVDYFSFSRAEQQFHAHRYGISGQLHLLAQLQLHSRNNSAHSQHVHRISHSFTSEIIENIFLSSLN